VVTSDFIEANNEVRYGCTYLDSVKIYNCSQYGTYKAALRCRFVELSPIFGPPSWSGDGC